MNALEEISEAIRRAAEGVGASVVGVDRHGTGLVVERGTVVTNAHNLRGPELAVQLPDGTRQSGRVRAVDVEGDLAVLEVETGSTPAVSLESTSPSLGDVVVALANPRGRGVRATVGTISSIGRSFRGPRGRRIAGGLEHTAPLGRGSSGGPLVSVEGKVIGLNTHRLQDGFYMAMPTDADLISRLGRLARGEELHRHRLGVAIAPPPVARHLRSAAGLPEADGLLVRHVEEDGPGARAGLRRGDVLTTAADRPLTSVEDLYSALSEATDSLVLGLVRATEEMSLTIVFGPDAGGAPTV